MLTVAENNFPSKCKRSDPSLRIYPHMAHKHVLEKHRFNCIVCCAVNHAGKEESVCHRIDNIEPVACRGCVIFVRQLVGRYTGGFSTVSHSLLEKEIH